MSTKKTYLVTGGLGFIGLNFIEYLLKKFSNINVINIDSMVYPTAAKNLEHLASFENHHFVKLDITDRSSLEKLFKDYDFDVVVHFAAESHVDTSIINPGSFIDTNIVGTFNLLDISKNYIADNNLDQNNFRFHHISTDEVYGSLSAADPSFKETNKYFPNSPYSASKASSDHLVRAYFHTFGMPITISNCSNNYGPFQDNEKLIPKIIDMCKKNESIPIYGDGKNVRDWLYVEDHCEAIDCIIKNGIVGETYNVGGECELNNLQIVDYILSSINNNLKFHTDSQIKFVTDRAGHDFRYSVNIDKIKKDLDWNPKTLFLDGLAKTLNHYFDV